MQNLLSLHVLLIEDNPSDALLLQRNLEMDRISRFTFTHVERLSDGLEQLQGEKFDIVLLDLGLPDSIGLEGFERLHKQYPDLPVVVFSGNEDEEQAVRAVSSGAQDYLMKSLNGFEMAGRTIRYAIERQMSEQRFHAIFHASPTPQIISELGIGRILDVNPAYCRLVRFSRDELIGHETDELGLQLEPDDRQKVLGQFGGERRVQGFETELKIRSGELLTVIISIEPLELGGKACIVSSVIDITERKQSEKLIRQWAHAFESCAHGIAIGLPASNTILTCNPAFARLQGRTIEEISSMPILSMYVPEDREHVLQQIAEADRKGNNRYEVHMLRKDGASYPVQMDVVSVRDETGTILYRVATQQDITERKQAEQKIRESEALLRQVLESTQDSIFAVDRDYRLLINNERHQHVLTETGGHPLRVGESILPPDYLPEVLEHWRGLYDRTFNGEEFKWETGWPYSDGQQHTIENNFSPLRDATGAIAGALVVIRDITERKQADESLRREKEKLDKIAASVPGVICSFHQSLTGQAGMPYASLAAKDVYGLDPQDIADDMAPVFSRILPEDMEHVSATIAQSAQTMEVWKDEFRYQHPTKGMIWIEGRSMPVRDADGSLTWHGFISDITERKQAEEKLRQSEKRARAMLDAIPDMMFRLDRSGTFLDYKADVKDLHEQSLSLIGQRNRDISPPEFAELIERKIEETLASGQTQTFEYQLSVPNGGVVEFEARMAPSGSDEVIAIVRNITDRKRAEAALVVSEQRLSSMFNHAMDAIITTDKNMRVIIYNNAAEQMFKVPKQEALGQLISRFIPDRFHQSHGSHMAGLTLEKIQNIAPGKVFSITGRRANGEEFPAESTISYVEAGEEKLYTAIIRDVTERKQAEEQIRQSEKRFATIFENSPLAIGVTRLANGIFTDINSAFTKMLGYTREEILGHTSLELDLWWDPTDRQTILQRLKQGIQTNGFESALRTKNGEKLFVLMAAELYEINGELSFLIQLTDITERKHSEAELRLNSEIMANMAEGVVLTRASDATVVYTNPKFDEMFGYERGELLYKEITMINAPTEKSPADIAEDIKNILHQTGGWSGEVYNIKKNGNVFLSFANVSTLNHPEYGEVWVAVHSDITAKKQAEESLRASEEMLRRITESIQEVFWMFDNQNQKMIYISPAYEVIWGRTPESLYQDPRQYIEAILPEDRPAMFAALQKQAAGEPTFMDYRIKHTDDSIRWIRDRSFPIFDKTGAVTQTTGIAIDVTDSKQVELALRESEEKYRLLSHELEERVRQRTAEIEVIRERLELATQAAGLGVWEWNVQTNQLHWDEQMFVIHRKEKSAFTSDLESFLTSMHPDDVGFVLQATQELMSGALSQGQIDYRIIRGDGSIGYLKTHGIVQYNSDNQIERVIGVAQDVTQERVAAEALRTSQASLQNFLDTASDLIQSLNEEGNILYVNTAWCTALGYTVEEALQLTMFDIVEPGHHEYCREILKSLILDQHPEQLEVVFKTRDGREVLVEGRVSSRKDENGHIVTNGIFRDITQRRQAENALRESEAQLRHSRDELTVAYHALEKAARTKDEFLANMSHELRTPLNGILGMSEILLEGIRGPLNKHQQNLVTTIEASGQHLLSLINDVLDLSKIEADKLEIHLETVTISDVCRSSLSLVKEMAAKKGVTVTFEQEKEATSLQADPRRLKQILVNLLSNAIKFTPQQGKVTLAVHADPLQNCVELSVTDTGIGISAEDMQRLFTPFTQVDSSLTRRSEGTGLGLVLVKRLTELQGGSVSVVSEVGKGSSFTVSLPWRQMEEGPSAPSSTEASSIAEVSVQDSATLETILLVEDNETNVLTVGDYLEMKGYKLIYAFNGQEALEKADAYSPDIILMDIQMPVMDGLTAMRHLRANPRFADTPIIALTALAMDGDRERCIEAGATQYISKPVRLKELTVMIEHLLKKTP